MKIILCLIAMQGMLLFGAGTQNLLKNGSFTDGMNYWLPKDKNGVSLDLKAAPGGGNALKLISSKEHYVSNYSLKFKPDTDYTIKAKIKMDGSAQVYLYFCRSPEAGKYNTRSQVIRKTTEWTEVSLLLNSGNAKGMPVICRVIGQGTAWFAEIEALEGNHMPAENLYTNSDFKTMSRYQSVPDGWTPNLAVSIVSPLNYQYELVNVAPPVPGACVIKISNCRVIGQKSQLPIPGQTYTYSFYAKNVIPGSDVELMIRFAGQNHKVKLTDDWKRYSFTEKLKSSWPGDSIRMVKRDTAFYFSAPQFMIGKQAQPWYPPLKTKNTTEIITKETVARAESRKITGTPKESDWNDVPTYTLLHLSKGKQEALFPTSAKIIHNDHTLFVRIHSRTTPGIRVGDHNKLNWNNICDLVELYLTDTAADGTYIHYAVDVNGHDYTARNLTPDSLGITSTVEKGKEGWTADIRVPLSLFHSNLDWKIAFGRIYDHEKYGRTAMDWSLPQSRHNPADFGQLYGVSVVPVKTLSLAKLYASSDDGALCFEFDSFRKEMAGSTLTAQIILNGKTLWKTQQTLEHSKGKIKLPADYRDMTVTGTVFELQVTNGSDRIFYRSSRIFYLLFSSYAQHDKAMEVYPKYNIFTDKDKQVELIATLDRKRFDHLRITLIDQNGKAVYSAETSETLSIPSGRLPDGKYEIQVEAMKNGKVADVRRFESFRKLPFRPEIIRINRQQRCLANAEGNFIPMAYYSSLSSNYAFDSGLLAFRDELLDGTKKAGFNSIKMPAFNSGKQIQEWMTRAGKHNLPILFDMSQFFPKGYYDGEGASKLSGPETEKIMIEYTQKLQKMAFGKPGILAYAPYHEPGYYRGGKGIVDSYRVAAILPELQKMDPYRPITGFWAPPHWDGNGEPFGTIDGVDFFFVDIYTRDLRRHCDELFRIGKASRKVHRPLGQIFNIDNQGTEDRDVPTPAEYRAEVYAALIAGYRVFYNYIGIPAVRETWEEMKECNRRLPVLADFICANDCREVTAVNERDLCYAVYERGNEVLVIAASKCNDRKSGIEIHLEKMIGSPLKNGKTFFGGQPVPLKNGTLHIAFPPAGSNVWIFQK